MTVISVILGSSREGRFPEKPAKWILQQLKKRKDVDARLLDLRDFPMPFFDQPLTPAMPGRPPYKNEVVQRWTAAIAQSDGFVFVTPEYNYGPSAVLKNAIDWVYPEWNRKLPSRMFQFALSSPHELGPGRVIVRDSSLLERIGRWSI